MGLARGLGCLQSGVRGIGHWVQGTGFLERMEDLAEDRTKRLGRSVVELKSMCQSSELGNGKSPLCEEGCKEGRRRKSFWCLEQIVVGVSAEAINCRPVCVKSARITVRFSSEVW